jgi:predicted histone-like DNA-binding protein
MATNHIRLGINYRQNKNEKSSAYGKYYAEIDRRETLTTAGLAAHLAEHNFGMGEDAIYAVLTRLSKCIPELLAQGVPVKIDGLGIFSTTLKSMGIDEQQLKSPTFNPTTIVQGVRIRFRPDGQEMNNLTSKAFLSQKVSLQSNYVVEKMESGEKEYTAYKSLEEFRLPAEPEP